jgi:hypothetical protein
VPDGREARVTGRRIRQMRSLPTNVADSGSTIRWIFESYLEIIEEFACDPEAFGPGGPGGEEVKERIRQAVERRDGKAEDEAILDGMRVETRELWQGFPELQLLGDHFRRAALRKEGGGSPDSTDPPSEEEGFRLAKAMLAQVPGRSLLAQVPGADWLNMEWESESLSTVLADQWLFPIEARTHHALLQYIELSKSNRVYFDALKRIREKLNSQGEAIPSPLIKWFQEVDSGRRRPPRERPIPNHRPVTLPKFLSDLNIQLTIEILHRVGISPEGSVSGCHIVSEALATSEDPALRLFPETVRGIWQKRIWGSPFEPVMGKYSKAIEERHGPFHNSRA